MINSFHYKLMRTHFAMNKTVMAQAKTIGLTSGQPKILEFLLENEGVEQKSIAESCRIESATVGSILLRMEEAGLIERRRLGGNRRSLYVYLTPEGRQAALETEGIFSRSEDRAFSGMSDEEIAFLNRCLDKVYNNLSK